LGDTLPAPPVLQSAAPTESVEPAVEVAPPFVPQEEAKAVPVPPQEGEPQVEAVSAPEIPGGAIAFALFDATPGLEVYEVHLINPDGTQHRRFPLAGVSEPALHPNQNDYPLAVRGWGGSAISRQLVSSDLEGNSPQAVSHFWEDAQPDWSPIENRLIFASQRESDRRWRLYTAWGDGSLEVNLRREGKSPTLAPNGQHFAFEGCDETGNRCGLWLSSLGESEHEAQPFLIDPEAKAPDWSPVNEEIVYMTSTGDNWDIYLINSNGRNRRRLTDDPANEGLPTWSPDGEWIAFVSDRGGQWGIWLLHLASDQLFPVTTFEENLSLTPPSRYPLYHEHHERQWWDEQLSWGSGQ
jgi:Tol biopolymer transport system component